MKPFTLLLGITIGFLMSCNNQANESKPTPIYIETEEFSKLNLPFSQAVKVGNLLYLSGQVGDNQETGELAEGGIGPQTRQAMMNIKEVLEQNGSSMEHIVKCTCMLADIKDWGEMSKEYIKFFPDHKPSRSAFATTGLALGALVEIECMAYVDKQ